MLLRRLARPLMAAIFVASGVQTLRDPSGPTQAAKPFLDKTIGSRADSLPAQVPTDAQTLVRLDAAVKVVAGSALAAGKFPRLSALVLAANLVPTTLATHAFWEYSDESERSTQLVHFFKNASMCGGLLLAAADTEGKPSVGWRARRATDKASKKVQKTSRKARRAART
ncbi:putative membrane protein YphA (DoxX/SURF4 family) [Tamaricihabitans halophyticus]|uniref:Putative membrane protein YphA (DoxX/SURF4 family) n=1 Tax=Tamaricihabitans halophyticus TaxID=1262583 RepID=A0A4R2R5Q0_9PSEU|nr:DoxX family protein [Tamaricihabitans halophyticus]TCP57334.1 putative membrane protein YphA (DoxX/SURF4 family) [Tamaricihabitans halophyticus]